MSIHHAIAALIWDIDGIFVDTEEQHFQAWKKLLAEFGKTLSVGEYSPLIGRGSTENMAIICAWKGIIGNHDELNRRRRVYFGELRKKGIPIFQHNIALVHAFAAQYPNLIQVAASSSIASDVAENLAAARLTDSFQLVVCKDRPDIRRKPAPDLYILVLEKLKLPGSACLAFEDTKFGVAAAKAAGVRVVALPNALTTGQNFSAADLVIGANQPRRAKDILEKFAR